MRKQIVLLRIRLLGGVSCAPLKNAYLSCLCVKLNSIEKMLTATPSVKGDNG